MSRVLSLENYKTGGQERYYKHMIKAKGKKYADAVEKKYNRYNATAAATGMVLIGASIANMYIK